MPLYFLAEDLFVEIIKSDQVYTQGDLERLAHGKIEKCKSLLFPGTRLDETHEAELQGMLGARESSAELLKFLRAKLRDARIEQPRVVLLVDELEVQYRTLQRRVQCEADRSPLRELSEQRYLKFLALAPAGIYEMGNADQTRVKRLIIPPADVAYIREHLISEPGRANAAWWLSRGKARHLIKACEILRDLPANLSPSEASRLIRGELDQVGQHPTQVPAAVTEDIPSSKVPYLFDVAPRETQPTKCYHVDSSLEGDLADHMAEALSVHRDIAMLFAEYFTATVRALADADGVAYITGDELPELFALSLDHLLEYEHASPALSDRMGDLLGLYERLKTDPAALYGGIATIWNNQPSQKRLRLQVHEIRRAFPFPLMNPIVKDHVPHVMRAKYEGKGSPLWRWSESAVTCLCFASARDISQYAESDEFLSICLPDGCGVLMLVFSGEMHALKPTPLMNWLTAAGKLHVQEVPKLLTDFLLSALGEIGTPVPGDLKFHLERFCSDKSDIILSRKAGIYADAVTEIVSSALPQPTKFCGQTPPDTDKWGAGEIRQTAAVCSLALAFTDLSVEHKTLLARLRELYKGGREGRGAGDLNKLKPRGGTSRLAEDVLPRFTKTKVPSDSAVVQHMQSYWLADDRDSMAQLARLVPLDAFLKLAEDADRKRMLVALWRSVRQNFGFDEELRGVPTLLDLQRSLKSQVLPTVDKAWDLERDVKQKLKMTGISFGSDEPLVKAKPGLNELCEIMETGLKLTDTAGAGLVRAIVRIFGSELDIKSQVNSLQIQCSGATQAAERLLRAAELLGKNYFEYPDAVRFAGLLETDLQEYASERLAIRQTLTPQQLAAEAQERQQDLERISSELSHLEKDLTRLRETLEAESSDE